MSAAMEEGKARTSLLRFRQAVAEDLRLFALLQHRELDRDLLMGLRENCGAEFLGLRLVSEEGREAQRLLRFGLADLPADLNEQTLDILAVEYADIFLNNSLQASPCESVWIDEEGLTMQEPMFQVRAWYKRFGLAVEDWRKRTDDHLVSQLRFLSHVLDSDEDNAVLSEVARFLDEHLLRWIHDFAERVGHRCRTRVYAGLVRLTAAYLGELRDLLAEVTGEPVPLAEEIDRRMRPQGRVAVQIPGPYVPGTAPSW